MDKMFDVLLAVVFAVFVAKTIPVMACPQGENVTTGSACSISEINNMVNSETHPDNLFRRSKPERDLRPVRIMSPFEGRDELKQNCPVGSCLYKMIFE